MISNAETLKAETLKRPVARIKFVGHQPGFGHLPGFDLYNTVEAIPGFPAHDTVTLNSLAKAGYDWEVVG